MRSDTLTLILSGEVPLDTFALALQHFNSLVKGLSAERGASDIDWLLNDLQVSSAFATAIGVGEEEKVARVVRAYEEVGGALERNAPVPYSPRVQRPARALRAIPGRRIESITLETSEREAVIRRDSGTSITPPTGSLILTGQPPTVQIGAPPLGRVPAYGAVEGRVQTLSSRGGLRFTLYDLLHDKAVSCYLAEGHEEIMRDVWGRLATVEGLVTRDPLSGRPLAVRQITAVSPKPERPMSYRDARGAGPSLSGLLPEHAIRRLRDA